jgi:hypothetical protein
VAPIVLVQELADRGAVSWAGWPPSTRGWPCSSRRSATARPPVSCTRCAIWRSRCRRTPVSPPARACSSAARRLRAADARITLLLDARADLDEAVERFFANLTPPSFAVELRRAAAALRTFVPPQLTTVAADAPVQQRIDALFDAIDPTPLVAELDAISAAIMAKLETLKQELVNGIVRILRVLFGALDGVMPSGMVGHLHAFMEVIRGELAALDPAPIKQEMHALVDSVINVVNGFSPAALAARLGVLFDAVKAKVRELSPAALVGDTTVLDQPFQSLQDLRPSIVLEPLVAQAVALEAALRALLDLELGDALVQAVIRLRVAIDGALDDLFAEFEELLAFLEGGGDVSASVSVG